MFGKIDPSQMGAMMKKLGMKSEEIPAKRVIIETSEKNIIIENPNVVCVEMQGMKNYQISGEEKTEEKQAFSDEDVKMVMEKTGKTKDECIEALKETEGDIAEAIMMLQS